MKVVWTSIAENKLREIFEYYEAKARKRVAKRVVRSILKRTVHLEKNPYLGPVDSYLNLPGITLRHLTCENYKIIYEVVSEKSEVVVLILFHCKQNPSWENAIRPKTVERRT